MFFYVAHQFECFFDDAWWVSHFCPPVGDLVPDIFLQGWYEVLDDMWVSLIFRLDSWWLVESSSPSIHIYHYRLMLQLLQVLQFLSSFIHCWCMKETTPQFWTSSSSVSSLQDKTTCHTAPVDFLKISVLKSLLLALQAWLISSIQSSNACLFEPSKILMGVNIALFTLSLLALGSSWNASCWLL